MDVAVVMKDRDDIKEGWMRVEDGVLYKSQNGSQPSECPPVQMTMLSFLLSCCRP